MIATRVRCLASWRIGRAILLGRDLRTPATSLAGFDLFARKDAERVGIYGSGQQAWATFAGLCEMRQIDSAKVYSPTPAHREGFAKKIMAKTSVTVHPVDRRSWRRRTSTSFSA